MTPWPSQGLRRASIQSFGFGGSNSHIILDDAHHFLLERGLEANHNTCTSLNSNTYRVNSVDLSPQIVEPTSTPRLLVWSAADEAGIKRTKDIWQSHCHSMNSSSAHQLMGCEYIPQLAHTLAYKRSHLKWRSFAVVQSLDNLANVTKEMTGPFRRNSFPKLGFVFTGVSIIDLTIED